MSNDSLWFSRLNLDNPYGIESYVLAILLAILVSVVSYPLVNVLDIANIIMLFLLEVFLCALWLGQGPSLVAALASVLLFDFFFVPPQFALLTTSVEHIVTLIVMLLIALLTGQITATLLAKNQALHLSEELTNSLYRMARELAGTVDKPQVETIAEHYPHNPVTESLLEIARERLHYADIAQVNRLQVESERLRASILSSLSHDLRTPLTALVGLTETLKAGGEQLSQPVQQEMLEAVHEQSVHLADMVTNLLDLARLSAGKLSLRTEWHSMLEVVGSALRLLNSLLPPERVQINIPANFPLLLFDAVLIERVVGNLLENAAKHTPTDTLISIHAHIVEDHAEICIADHGAGFPPHMLLAADARPPTTGLGLVICEAIIKAHQGSLHLEQHASGGACIRFTLPLGIPPVLENDPEEEFPDYGQ